MIDIDSNEVEALLALVQWWEQSDGAAWDRSKDADIRAAARKLARPAPASQKIDAARNAKQRAIYERSLLIRWITKLVRKGAAHLDQSTDTGSMLPYVVCVHVGTDTLTWRIGADEAESLFAHLRRVSCSRKAMPSKAKLAYLEQMK